MTARFRLVTSVLVLTITACNSAAPGGSQPTTGTQAPTATLASVASVAPTTPPAAATPGPWSSPGTTVNADGSVWIRPPTLFDFAQPGDDGAVWGLLQYADVGREIVRLDLETYEFETVVRGLPILPNPVSPVAHNGSIWLVSWDKSSVTQYDAESGELIREIKVGKNPIEPVVAYGDVWTIDHNGDSVTRIDSVTGAAYPPIDLPGSHPLQITVVDDDLMLVYGPGPTTFVVDPARMELLGTYEPADCFADRHGVIEGLLWLKQCDMEEIAIVDPRTGEVLDSFESPVIPYPPLIVDGNVWLPSAAHNGPGTFGLVGLDPETHEGVGAWEQPAAIHEGSSFAAFDSWWRWGWEGLIRVPADTLREATR